MEAGTPPEGRELHVASAIASVASHRIHLRPAEEVAARCRAVTDDVDFEIRRALDRDCGESPYLAR
jgi:hypothetical protein